MEQKLLWNGQKRRTPNKRFGVSRGVCSRKVLREFESLSPVRALAFPRPNAKPPTVGRQLAKVARKLKQEIISKKYKRKNMSDIIRMEYRNNF